MTGARTLFILMAYNITVDYSGFKHWTKQYPKQIGFAASSAINTTMKQIQRAGRAQLHQKLIIRRESFARMSVKIAQFSNKHSLLGVVGLIPPGAAPKDFWNKQQFGGQRTPSHGSFLAIPTTDIRPNVQASVTRSKWPRQLRNTINIQTKGGKHILLQRKGRGKTARITVPYVLVRSVQLTPKIGWFKMAQGIVDHNFSYNFAEAFHRAIATAL